MEEILGAAVMVTLGQRGSHGGYQEKRDQGADTLHVASHGNDADQ